MAAGESPMVGGLRRVRVDWFLISGKCDSSSQTFPHLAAFLASDSFLRAIRVFLIVRGGLLPVLRDAFGSDIISEGRRQEHKIFSDTVVCLLNSGSTPIVKYL
jgi:hypothetical protein